MAAWHCLGARVFRVWCISAPSPMWRRSDSIHRVKEVVVMRHWWWRKRGATNMLAKFNCPLSTTAMPCCQSCKNQKCLELPFVELMHETRNGSSFPPSSFYHLTWTLQRSKLWRSAAMIISEMKRTRLIFFNIFLILGKCWKTLNRWLMSGSWSLDRGWQVSHAISFSHQLMLIFHLIFNLFHFTF